MHLVVDTLYLLGIVLASPWLLYRLVRTRGWREIAGRFRPGAAPAGAVWFHGSSVGEVSLIRPLIRELAAARPELPVVVSSHTATGFHSASRAYPEHTVLRFPFDFSGLQRRLMRRLQPKLVVVVESDLWPNQLLAAERQGVPVAIVNAKLSERSARWHRVTGIVPRAMRKVALVAAQTEAHAERFRRLGVAPGRVVVTGNMKYDLTADDGDPDFRRALRRRLGFAPDDVVVIGGSLHPGEDDDLLAACAAVTNGPAPVGLVIVPRYPDQAGSVLRHAREAGFAAVSKSELDRDPGRMLAAREVLVVDTLGELRRLYAAADIALVGGSLYYRGANKGGHNLMEPAILGLPVLFGPHNFSFRETVADLLDADAGVLVRDRAELVRAIAALVDSPGRRRDLGRRARRVVLERQGASARNLALILSLLESAAPCSANLETAQSPHQPQGHALNE